MKGLISINHPNCEALISTQGAQLLQWKPKNASAPILWCADLVTFVEGKPLRGGVPICWPWFGKQKQPAHGFVRLIDWLLVEQKENFQGVMLTFKLKDSNWTRKLWPHAFSLHLNMWLGETCKIELHIDCNQTTTGALHSYLYVDDVAKVAVAGLGSLYTDIANKFHSVLAPKELVIPYEGLDCIYTCPESVTNLLDPGFRRKLMLQHSGHSDLVIWNPGEQGVNSIADMQSVDYKKLICIETAAITKPLGSSLSVNFTLR